MTTPTENIVAGQDEQGSVGTSTMVDPQVRRMQTAKKMLRGCGGTEGKTNELMTVTWRRKPDRNVSRYCICLLSIWKRSFRHHMQMSCTFPRMNVSPASVRKEKSMLVILKLDFQLFFKQTMKVISEEAEVGHGVLFRPLVAISRSHSWQRRQIDVLNHETKCQFILKRAPFSQIQKVLGNYDTTTCAHAMLV